MSMEVKRRRSRFLGHVLRMPRELHCDTALSWTPMGKRKVSHPKTTWCHIVEKERAMADWKSWEESEFWLRTGACARGVLQPYTQQSTEKIGEVTG